MSEDIQIKWKINSMDCYPEYNGSSNYIFNVNWSCLSYYNGNNGGPFEGEVKGSTKIPPSDSSSSFTPYERLGEDQVMSWVHAVITTTAKENFENEARQQILNQINPPTITLANPWGQNIFPIIPPSIECDPPKQITIWSGQNAYLAIGAKGQPLNYQWKRNSQILENATGEGLQILNAQVDQAGIYNVSVYNSLGSVETSGCNIIVKPPEAPTILDQPKGMQVFINSQFILNVRAKAYPKPQYQWMFNDVDIPGAVKEGYMIEKVKETDAGDYSVRISNFVGSVVSNIAPLIIKTPA